MPCYHPLHAFKVGLTDNGKDKYQIESGKVEKIHPRQGNKLITDRWITEYTEVPCGKCIGCRLGYSREWADRCMLEAKNYEYNQFITLTYDPEHINLVIGVDRETGEITDVGTLVPEDLTKFIKDLRRYYQYHYQHQNIRFYACGEYGSNTYRPHYHIIAFNLPVEDREYLFSNVNRDRIYTSDIISKIWGKGIVTVGDVTWNSCAYVARYVMKKVKGPEAEEYYQKIGVVPEFVRMSRKPGIARDYYEENKNKIYESDEIVLTNKKGLAKVVKPSKYFDRLYDIEEPELMKAIKEKRRITGELARELQLAKTSLNKEEYLKLQEENKQAQLKLLKRII